ncbi:hypothetical protein ABZ128_20590 [Streptomyces sp. NPDC006326]|uniref:hypothetical protein n=1 Tax=Streptomyces sp. NPDC006326 TaxID=3156752 RepID=UPI0033B4C96B
MGNNAPALYFPFEAVGYPGRQEGVEGFSGGVVGVVNSMLEALDVAGFERHIMHVAAFLLSTPD